MRARRLCAVPAAAVAQVAAQVAAVSTPYDRRPSNAVTNCKSCRAPIVWCTTVNGKRMPVDAVPVDDGDWTFDDGVVVRFVSGGDPDVLRYHAHWFTCPNAEHHRRVKVRDIAP